MTILVSGFGRCGSSLVMQMLQAAGLKYAGDYPAFEHDAATSSDDHYRREAFSQFDAIKILDPHRFRPVRGTHQAIWLDRDPEQQALSQIKFIRVVTRLPIAPDYRTVKKLMRSYRTDRPFAIEALKVAGADNIIFINFKELVSVPHAVAGRICRFLQIPDSHYVMAGVVRLRSPTAQPDMSIEMELMNRVATS